MTERPQEDVVELRERGRVEATEVSWAVRSLQRAQNELDRALAHRLDLRALDYTAMTHLLEAESALGPVELAARLGISSGSGTELADRLERAGHLHRRRATEDRRRIVLDPDPGSIDRMLRELAPLFAAVDGIAEQFTAEQRAVITRYLDAVAATVRSHARSLAGS